MMTEYMLLGASALLLLGILASKLSSRLGVPTLLVFLLVGMLAGSEGPGGIYFDDPKIAQSLGVVSLILILYAGGLETLWSEIRPILLPGLLLSTFGVLATALLVGWFARLVLGFSWLEGFLLGAVVSSTDAAAVFSVLRSRSVGLKGSLKTLLEFESGSNDPMAVFLTTSLISLLVHPSSSILGLIPEFLKQMTLGATLGYSMGFGMVFLINRLRLEYEGLYPVSTLALVLLTYGVTVLFGGNGFLAVYIAGIVMGNKVFIHKKGLIRFHDGMAWLMQTTMFLTLGLLVFPSHLIPIAGIALLVSVFLMAVARPLSVFLTLFFAKMGFKEKLMISWVGLRGAAPIILATFPLLSGISKADTIFNVVFFIVLTSALLQGTSIPWVAKWLGLDTPLLPKPKYPMEFEPTQGFSSDMVEIEIPKDSNLKGKRIVEVEFPKGTLVLLIRRGEEFIIPTGETVLKAGDSLLVLSSQEGLPKLQDLFK